MSSMLRISTMKVQDHLEGSSRDSSIVVDEKRLFGEEIASEEEIREFDPSGTKLRTEVLTVFDTAPRQNNKLSMISPHNL